VSENGWDEEDDWEDEEEPEDDEESMIPCPHCKRQIHEESQRCPYCENYISEEDTAPALKSWWIILGALLTSYIVYRWIVG
jgi:hypothetical protein